LIVFGGQYVLSHQTLLAGQDGGLPGIFNVLQYIVLARSHHFRARKDLPFDAAQKEYVSLDALLVRTFLQPFCSK
jgi:hypothetical protein